MEKRVTCPKCEHAMTVNIWSDTLTQVLKCAACGKKFTYDPSTAPADKEIEPRDREQASRTSKEATVSRMIGKGIRNGINAAAAPVRNARREMDRIVGSMNDISNSKPPEAITSDLKKEHDRKDGSSPPPPPPPSSPPSPPPPPPPSSPPSPPPPPPPSSPPFTPTSPSSPPPSPLFPRSSSPRETSKSVSCPQCTRLFQAGLPDNDKQILTTKCPDCGTIFSFDRSDPPAARETVEETENALPPGDRELQDLAGEMAATVPAEDEDFAVPLALKEKLERERQEQEHVWGSRDELSQTDDEHKEVDAGPRDEDTDSLELAPEPRQRKGPRGRLLSVVCPYCTESFGTPAPITRGKVVCPICEQVFVINAHGEYIAKKALGNFAGGLARIVGVKAIRTYQDTVRDSFEGVSMLRDSQDLHHHMRSYSGKAGFLLMVVSILGILFAGYLLLAIPDSGEDDPSGAVLLTGNVKSGLDLIEGAQVNITDVGRTTETSSEGEFQFDGVETGDHSLEITASGKGKLIVHFTIGSKEAKQGTKDLHGLVLPESGTVVKDLREDRVERAGLILGLQAAFIFMVSLLALMGGLLAVQGKRFHATLFFAAISVVSIGFFIGMVLAILSIVLIMLGRKEFIS